MTVTPINLVCSDCHRLFDPDTGEIVDGWGDARWIDASKETCKACMKARSK